MECKTASPYNTDKWKEGEIPPHYLMQCFHYMAVTGKKEWYIAVVILGQEQKQIEQEVKCFMQDHETAFSDKYRVNWTNIDTTKLDAKRIKEEVPEIYQSFSKTTTSRRFTVKAA